MKTGDTILIKLPGQFNLKDQFFIWFGWLIKFTLIHLVTASEPGQAISQKPVSTTAYTNKHFHMNYLENWS